MGLPIFVPKNDGPAIQSISYNRRFENEGPDEEQRYGYVEEPGLEDWDANFNPDDIRHLIHIPTSSTTWLHLPGVEPHDAGQFFIFAEEEAGPGENNEFTFGNDRLARDLFNFHILNLAIPHQRLRMEVTAENGERDGNHMNEDGDGREFGEAGRNAGDDDEGPTIGSYLSTLAPRNDRYTVPGQNLRTLEFLFDTSQMGIVHMDYRISLLEDEVFGLFQEDQAFLLGNQVRDRDDLMRTIHVLEEAISARQDPEI